MKTQRSQTFDYVLRAFWMIAAAVWTSAVVALALSSDDKIKWVMKSFSDKVLHALAFTVGAIVWVKASEAASPRRFVLALVVGGIATLLVGVAIEIFQQYVPSRKSDINDFLADVVGVLFAFAVLVASRVIASRRARANP